mgnify:FL=1
MAILREYYRPQSVGEAAGLLARGGGHLLALAGGTKLIGLLETRTAPEVEGVVDLRSAGLDYVRSVEGALHVGAMCTLAALTEHAEAAALAGGLLLRAVRGEGPVNLRNAATVGGAVACAEYDSEFYAALLALGASVTVLLTSSAPPAHNSAGERTTLLAEMGPVHGLVLEVQIPLGAASGGAARIARTPSDRPIVAALAARGHGGVRVALCGVAQRPVPEGMPLDPPDDFKASREYRLAMASIVARRARAELGE